MPPARPWTILISSLPALLATGRRKQGRWKARGRRRLLSIRSGMGPSFRFSISTGIRFPALRCLAGGRTWRWPRCSKRMAGIQWSCPARIRELFIRRWRPPWIRRTPPFVPYSHTRVTKVSTVPPGGPPSSCARPKAGQDHKWWMVYQSREPAGHTKSPCPECGRSPEHLAQLEARMRSYRPEELFDAEGQLIAELAGLAPDGGLRMGASAAGRAPVARPC